MLFLFVGLYYNYMGINNKKHMKHNKERDMFSKEKLNRINELARKKKSTGLIEEEIEEQKILRQEYLENFRQNFKKQLDNIDLIDE